MSAGAAVFAFAGASRLLVRSLDTAAGDRTGGLVGLGMRALSQVFPRRVFLNSLALSLANHAVFVAGCWLVANALSIPSTNGVAAIVFCVNALALSRR